MASNGSTKRSRTTAEQLSYMLDFFQANPGLAGGKFLKLHGKLESNKKWAELAEMLNCLGGATKSVEQWQTVWRDLKSRTSIKVQDRKRQQALTGNKPLADKSLTEMEMRVMDIVGKSYVEGHDTVLENVPMKEELQLRLEDGELLCAEVPAEDSPSRMERGRCNTPVTPRRTPRGRNRAQKEEPFLLIAQQQADALKMLAESNKANAESLKMIAECSAANIEAIKMLTEGMKALGEGLKASAEAFNNLTSTDKNP